MRKLRISPAEVVVLKEGVQDNRRTKFIFPANPWKSECVSSILRAVRGGHQVDSSELGWLYTLGCVSIENRSSAHFELDSHLEEYLGSLPASWSKQRQVLDPYLERFSFSLSDSDLEREVLTIQLAHDLFDQCWSERLPKAPGLEIPKMDSDAFEYCGELAKKVVGEMREDRLFDAVYAKLERSERWHQRPKLAVIPWGNAHYNSIEKWILSQGYIMKSKTEVSTGSF